MWEIILKAFSVYLSATLKFIFGPLGGMAAGLNVFITIGATVAGMMTSVGLITFFGDFLRKRVFPLFRKRKNHNQEDLKDQQKKLKWKKVYDRYGLGGIAFLTPVILTPIGGTLLAVGFGSPRPKILLYMLISAGFWSVVLTFSIYLGHDWIVDYVKRVSNV